MTYENDPWVMVATELDHVRRLQSRCSEGSPKWGGMNIGLHGWLTLRSS